MFTASRRFGGNMTTPVTTQRQATALVIGNYKSRCGVVKVLQGPEFYVCEATACIQGLKHILERSPDVVIIHQNKPSGAVIKLLRAVKCLTSAPVIVVGCSSAPAILQALLHGADAYLPRRFEAETLLACIHILLSRN
jgi:DNA-binding response OmpR family regulator